MEETLELESNFFTAGEERGFERGRALGIENGKRHGMEEGHQLGFELGFAEGVAEALAVLQRNDESVTKAAKALHDAVSKTKLDNVPHGADVQRVRARFKVLESRAGLSLSAGAHRDMTF
jgi:hypothetical protein